MQKEYKSAMEKLSLSEDAKTRILANVKLACGQTAGDEERTDAGGSSENVVPMQKQPRFSLRRIGAAAAAFAVVCAGVFVIQTQFGGPGNGNLGGSSATEAAAGQQEEVWEELDSVDDIGTKTDCRTYTLGKTAKKYKVKKVEVARAQKHVRITYHNKKQNNRILFEYKEEKDAVAVTGQFENETKLAVEKVGDFDVTMYGEDKCEGMTWQKESCTFGVRMTRACSKAQAKKMVSGTKRHGTKSGKTGGSARTIEGNSDTSHSANAVGWSGDEESSSDSERKSILKKIFEKLGFRVTIKKPATDITYKRIGDYESFAFYYNDHEDLEYNRIYGYAGWQDCPDGVMENFEKYDKATVNGVKVKVYQKPNGEKLFKFVEQDLSFTLLIEDWTGDDIEDVFSALFGVIRITVDDTDEDDEPDKGEDSNPSKSSKASVYREMADEIKEAVLEKNFRKLASYVDFPIDLPNIEATIKGPKQFRQINEDEFFTTGLVNAVSSFDTDSIRSDTKTFIMGDEKNSFTCKIKNNVVSITEIHISGDLPVIDSDVMPEEE